MGAVYSLSDICADLINYLSSPEITMQKALSCFFHLLNEFKLLPGCVLITHGISEFIAHDNQL